MMKMHHRALAHPDRSSLRKMSPKTTISSQIQMKKRKNHNMDQNTWPVPNSAASMNSYLQAFWGWTARFRGGSCQSASASSSSRAFALASWASSETVGHPRSSASMASTMMAAAIACITRLWSAGSTYHGAQSVDVAEMASS